MIITFDKYLLGTENNTPAVNVISDNCMALTSPRTDGGFTWTANIGACGMAIATEG